MYGIYIQRIRDHINKRSCRSYRHRRPTNADISNIHLPRIRRRALISMKHNLRPISQNIRPTRRKQIIPASRHQQRASALRIRAHDTRGRGVRGIVIRPIETVGREKEDVDAFAAADQGGGFDEWAVGVPAVEDLRGAAARRDAVGFHGLHHDGRRHERGVAVVAVAAVPDAVAVDLVDNVDGAVRVDEAGRVDGSALAVVVWVGKSWCIW